MSILSFLPLFAGVGLFLYGMDMLAKAIERLAGARLEKILESLTSNKWKGLLLGTGVTAIIQSSAATSVTVVGFVNAGMMKLVQAIPVVFGANIGSTATAQILRLGDLQAGGVILSLLKPSTFAPVLIIAGAAINLMAKKRQTKNIAMLLMGFGMLFFGMTTMEQTLSPLKDSPAFRSVFTAFENPVLGILAGLGLTALIQSSSAAVGILQTLTVTGSVTFATTFPLLMGINIGKCLTVILASFGTNKNSKRTVVIHLLFNVIGAVVFTTILYGLNVFMHFPFMHQLMTRGSIADLHTGFNLLTALMLMPAVQLLVNVASKLIPDKGEVSENQALDYLDELFLKNPQVAMEQCRKVLCVMGTCIQENLSIASDLLQHFDEKKLGRLEENERFLDKCEASVGEYLVKTTHHTMTEEDSHLATEILQTVSDFERIGDYCVNISETAQYMHENNVSFTEIGHRDANLIFSAVINIVNQTVEAFNSENKDELASIEPLEEVIDQLVETLRDNHVRRLQTGKCSVNSGISFIELLNNMERISDHCSNIAIYIIQRQMVFENFDRHSYLKAVHRGEVPGYQERFDRFREQYLAPLSVQDDMEQMNLDSKLIPSSVQIRQSASDWKEAIRMSVSPLIDTGCADSRYSEAMIRNVEQLGAYYMAANQVMVLHARPEEGCYQTQYSITAFKEPVFFPHTGNRPIRLFICMASEESKAQRRELNLIGRILSDQTFAQNWQTCEKSSDLYWKFCEAEARTYHRQS